MHFDNQIFYLRSLLCVIFYFLLIYQQSIGLNRMSKNDPPESKSKQISLITIDSYYLNQFKLKQSMEHTRKCQYFYQKISEQVEEYYLIISDLPEKLETCLMEESKETHELLNTYKNYVKDFFEIFRTISAFQISGITKIRSSLSDFISNNFQDFKRKIESFSKVQGEFQQTKEKYNNFMLETAKMSEALQKILKKPEENYNLAFIKSNSENIERILAKKQAFQVVLNKGYEQIQQNCQQFQRLLAFHRHRLVSFKYDYIQKINRFCINSKQSLMEIAGYLYEFISQNIDIFRINKKEMEAKAKIRISKDRNEVIEMIENYGRRYNQQIDLIIGITQTVIGILTDAFKQLKVDKNNEDMIIEDMKKYFIYNQCNITDIVETMNLYRTLLSYLSELGDKLVFLEANLVQLRNNISKYKEILFSIVKCNVEDRSINSIKEPKNKSIQQGIDNYLEQMNEAYIKSILQNIVKCFQQTVNKIRNHFLLNQPLKRTIQNSMQISVIQTSRQQQKRPFKQDVWLWKTWKKEEILFFPNFQDLHKLKEEMKRVVELSQIADQEVDKMNCIFKSKRSKGVLILKSQSLLFESTSTTTIFYIPFAKIDNIDIDLSIMNNSLNIETYSGVLSFTCEQVKDLKRFYLSAQKSIDSFTQNHQQQLKIQKYSISQQQLMFIKKRKEQIKPQLQNLNQYEHFNTVVLHDVEIEDCYRVLVSDNKISVKGKQYDCFVHSLMKKFNNTNCTFQSFKSSGPAFYTGNKDIDFKNTPVFSERIIEYDHQLPKIPFMPQTCHNTQTVRVYWISNQQFQVREENKTSGAPYTENFSIIFYTIYEKILKGVQVRFFHKVTVHKEFSLQKMVISKAMQEAKWGNTILTEQMKKIMTGYKRKTSNQQIQKQLQQSNFSDKTRVKEFKTKIQSLQKNNKILIIGLGVILLVNIILHFFI